MAETGSKEPPKTEMEETKTPEGPEETVTTASEEPVDAEASKSVPASTPEKQSSVRSSFPSLGSKKKLNASPSKASRKEKAAKKGPTVTPKTSKEKKPPEKTSDEKNDTEEVEKTVDESTDSAATQSLPKESEKKSERKKRRNSERTLVRNTSFKAIRGFLSRSGRKPRIKAAPAASAASTPPKAGKENDGKRQIQETSADDQSTLYNVAVDERSAASSSILNESTILSEGPLSKIMEAGESDGSAAQPTTKPDLSHLRIVLLLMEVASRRFELLQLEFESEKATVQDVLSQIAISATEEALRGQSYRGMTGDDGVEVTPAERLFEVCNGQEVWAAVPSALSASQCARLARPILSDPKVLEMLKASKVETAGWKKSVRFEKDSKDGGSTTRSAPLFGDNGGPSAAPAKKRSALKIGGTVVFVALLMVVISIVLQAAHLYLATPLQPGQRLGPGIVLSKCGLLPCSHPAYFQVEPGRVTYTENGELTWIIHGRECKTEDCVEGLEFTKQNTLKLAGEPVKWLEIVVGKEKKVPLAPWPFAVEPTVKSWNSRKGA